MPPLISETNVPHAENIAYLIDDDEAHVAYQFALPPLIAITLAAYEIARLAAWRAKSPRLTQLRPAALAS